MRRLGRIGILVILATIALVLSDGGPVARGALQNSPVDSLYATAESSTPADSWSWIDMNPAPAPSSRTDVEMVYDSGADRVILFGGYLGGPTGAADTWAYDDNSNTWTNMSPGPHPSGRWGHAMAYDSRADRVILFGGFDGNATNDTWAYDFANNTWTNRNPVGSPPPAAAHGLAYDMSSDRVILFGGLSAQGDSNQTWAYDYASNAWTKLEPSVSPSGRRSFGMTYDSDAQRIVIFGGVDPNWAYFNETWAYSYAANTWSNLTTFVTPPRRYWPSIAYDTATHRTILFGGYYEGFGTYNDTWAFSLGFRAWGELAPQTSPPARRNFEMAYDTESDRVVLFGGYSANGAKLNDTWASGGPFILDPPTAPQDLRARPGNNSVNLTWQPPSGSGGAPTTAYRVYRAVGSENLSLLAEVGDVRSYADTNVTNGITYRYAVSCVNAIGEGPASAEANATPDGDPPTTRAFLAGRLGTDGWYVSSVNVSLEANDTGSGVTSTFDRVDDGSWVPYNGSFAVAGDGNHSLRYYSVDLAGNVEPTHDTSIAIDTTSPTSVLVASGTIGQDSWYVSAVTVTLSATDAGSGLSAIFYEVAGGGGWQSYSNPFVVADGISTIKYYAVDTAGNAEPTRSWFARVDTIAPVTDSALAGPTGQAGWYGGDVTVALMSIDEGSGVAALSVLIDSASWTGYVGPIVVSGQGVHHVRYFATDAAGNQETIRDMTFSIDSTPPTTSVAVQGERGNPGWMLSATTVELSSVDSVSGVAATYYRVDGATWQSYAVPLSYADGVRTIDFYSVDLAGNREPTKTLALRIDTDSPYVVIDGVPSRITTSIVPIEWSGGDSTSGIAGYGLSVDGGTFRDLGKATRETISLPDGEHRITVRATDVSGHTADVSIELRVDTNVFSLSGPYSGLPTFAVVVLMASLVALIVAQRRRRRRSAKDGKRDR